MVSRRRALRLTVATLVATAIVLVLAPVALAYWNFTGYLPGAGSGGNRWYVKYTNVSPGGTQGIRMSWTNGSHCMYFLEIDSGGGWSNYTICGSDPWCEAYYDCSIGIGVTSIYDRFGCHNPGGLSTVWVNCRATNPI